MWGRAFKQKMILSLTFCNMSWHSDCHDIYNQISVLSQTINFRLTGLCNATCHSPWRWFQYPVREIDKEGDYHEQLDTTNLPFQILSWRPAPSTAKEHDPHLAILTMLPWLSIPPTNLQNLLASTIQLYTSRLIHLKTFCCFTVRHLLAREEWMVDRVVAWIATIPQWTWEVFVRMGVAVCSVYEHKKLELWKTLESFVRLCLPVYIVFSGPSVALLDDFLFGSNNLMLFVKQKPKTMVYHIHYDTFSCCFSVVLSCCLNTFAVPFL